MKIYIDGSHAGLCEAVSNIAHSYNVKVVIVLQTGERVSE